MEVEQDEAIEVVEVQLEVGLTISHPTAVLI